MSSKPLSLKRQMKNHHTPEIQRRREQSVSLFGFRGVTAMVHYITICYRTVDESEAVAPVDTR